ncbi:MAG: hypothetical protein AB7E80_05390 [Hyphomicrobiaceae bacterium]
MRAANQTDKGRWPIKQVRASRPVGFRAMLGFLTIFAATLAGYTGVGSWSIAAAAIGLTSMSYARHQRLYERGQELGLSNVVESTLLRSCANALAASCAGYGFGWLIHSL